MGFLAYFTPLKTNLAVASAGGDIQGDTESVATESTSSSPSPSTTVPLPIAAQSAPNLATASLSSGASKPKRRITMLNRPFAALSPVHEDKEVSREQTSPTKRLNRISFNLPTRRLSLDNSDKRARESAETVRNLIIGPSPGGPDSKAKSSKALVARPQMSKVKSQLIQPKSANQIIAHLRTLSIQDQGASSTKPIHAVCLSHTDEEEDDLHFKKLDTADAPRDLFGDMPIPCVLSTSSEKLSQVFSDIQLVDFLMAPDLGLGQPGDGVGILSGALPTAETVLEGVKVITPALLEMAYTTGRAFTPDHTGIYPPTDRISVLTYWWGLEVVLPPPTLVYLSKAKSVSSSVINFLSALAMVNNGVREMLPFVRYISQFIDFEFQAINKQNKGRGVVCAATWIMPAAMVPRPWDFDPAPSPAIEPVRKTPIPVAGEHVSQHSGSLLDAASDLAPEILTPTNPTPQEPAPRLDDIPEHESPIQTPTISHHVNLTAGPAAVMVSA